MSKVFFREGAALTLENQPYTLERQAKDGTWVLSHARTGRVIEKTTAELFDAYAAEVLRFESVALCKLGGTARREGVDVDGASAHELESAKYRLLFVRAAAGQPKSQAALAPIIDTVWAGVAEPRPKKPSWVTVYRWLRAYESSDGAPLSLVVSSSTQGNRAPRFEKEVVDICQETIQAFYMKEERPGVVHVTNLAAAKVRQENRLRPTSAQLAMPTRRLIRRLIDEIPAYDRCVARFGREAARKRFRAVLNVRLTDSALQRGEMDHTRLNLLVVDDATGMPLGRPWLTVLLDDHTRCILGICISFEPPSRATVARCLRHAFMPKTGLRDRYPDLVNDWEQFGVVSELAMDGGVEFHSAEVESICFELNIEQHFAPRKTPWFKGKVERIQGTLNRETTASTPGKTFEGIVDREDYDPKKHAVVTRSGLEHLVVKWIVDVYHQRPHSALGCSPAQKWKNSIRAEDIPLMADPLRFDAILGGREKRVLSHKGIEFAGMLYNSLEMRDLRARFGDRIEVDVRVDRSDLGHVIVLHPQTREPLRVPCLRQDYAAGLTEWQHNVCRKFARDRFASGENVDNWLDALHKISDMVSKDLRLGRRKGVVRERIARWSEGKQAPSGARTGHSESAPPQASTPAAMPAQSTPVATIAPSVVRKRFKPLVEDRNIVVDVDGLENSRD